MERLISRRGRADVQGGSALLMALFIMIMLGSLMSALFTISHRALKEQQSSSEDLQALYLAEAGLNEGFLSKALGGAGTVGSESSPATLGSGRYWVSCTDMGDGYHSLVSTAEVGEERVALEMVVGPAADLVGFHGRDGVKLERNFVVDSYDSRFGEYAEQSEHGQAQVSSNGRILLAGTIYGDAIPGPGYTVEVGDGGEGDGSGTGHVSGSSEPAAVEFPPLPPVSVPSIDASGALVIEDPGFVMQPGQYHYTSLIIRADCVIRAPITLVVDNLRIAEGAQVTVETSTAVALIFCTGSMVIDDATTSLTPSCGCAPCLQLHVSASTTDPLIDVRIGEESTFEGLLYAPGARVVIEEEANVFGGIVAHGIESQHDDYDDVTTLHCDLAAREAFVSMMGGGTASGGLAQVLWRRL